MAQQFINLGAAANDGTGTKLRDGGDMINDNFTELYGLAQTASAAAPASASATGTAGQIAFDADYIYVCVATDTWKRAAIATWP